jgi:gliding motility-associated-like protein
MKHILVSILFSAIWFCSSAQTILMTDPDFDQINPLDCQVINQTVGSNFFDDGGAGGNYSPNFSDTIVFCPDLITNSKINVAFSFGWSVGAGDTVYAWDGPNTSAPYLGAHNSITDPSGFSVQASFLNNPSGCITIAFKTGAVVDSAGWEANVACVSPPQPFNPHMQGYVNGNLADSMSVADTGMITLCGQDSILYVATADFPYSLENAGLGYSQQDTNVTFKWFFSDGQIAVGDSVWYAPPNNAGYIITLQVTDQFPYTEQIVSSVRVAPRIDFSQTRALSDSICQGDSVVLVAGLAGNDTVGVSSTISITEVGGSFAGLTFLPDGNQVNYEAEIEITGFGPGQTLSSGMDIMHLAITMEHSYLGDLEMMLSCPNGDSVVVFNSWTGAGISPLFAGGFGGGEIFLGDALDLETSTPGIGWTYNFSDTIPDWGNMATEFANANFLPTTISNGMAMNPDSIYLPEQTFEDLVGCPVNGTWKLTIRDNIVNDNGYIFDWAIFFNPYINPNFESYTSQIVDSKWFNGISISDPQISGLGDTTVTIAADSLGLNWYTFEALDDFGCFSDTTIYVYNTQRPVTTNLDTSSCSNQIAVEVNLADSVFWSVYSGDSNNISFSPSNLDTSVTISTISTGIYLVDMTLYTNNCIFKDSAKLIYVEDLPNDLLSDTIVCSPAFILRPSVLDTAGVYTYEWGPTGETSDSIVLTETGTYFLTMTGCNVISDSVNIQLYQEPSIIGDFLICDSASVAAVDRTNLGGYWQLIQTSFAEGDFAFVPNIDSLYIAANERGLIEIGYFDSICNSIDTASFVFQHLPSASIWDSVICEKDVPLMLSAEVYPKETISYTWTGNVKDSVLAVYEAGIYKLEVENVCGVFEDTVHVSFRNCDYMIPNVLTPNGDGLNDVFFIKNREFYTSISFAVYNRWGMQILSTQGQLAYWDGRTTAGELCPDGTYFFVVEIDGAEETGSITLISGN